MSNLVGYPTLGHPYQLYDSTCSIHVCVMFGLKVTRNAVDYIALSWLNASRVIRLSNAKRTGHTSVIV